MRILVIGDIVGRPGRRAVKEMLWEIKDRYAVDFTVANGENAAGGRGINHEVTDELLSSGIDVLTMGNHVWDNKEIFDLIDDQPRLIRPCNYPPDTPGRGYNIFATPNGRIAVINASGRVFMDALECPFHKTDEILNNISGQWDICLIDFHAEATSEKRAFAYYFDGRATAVLGTHTHIQTADETILGGGTAYISDLGMTGPIDSILGMNKEQVIKKFLTQRPVRLEVAKGPVQIQGIFLEISNADKHVVKIERFSQDRKL
ncbi:MAG: TIGR00282 family metallophosphoesterase [Syntrophomonas sp.]